RARDAAYFRFRALDVARAGDASLTPTYEAALRDFVARHATDPSAAEARYLLGELARAQGDCPKAEGAYAQVTAGPFAPRARLGTLECDVGALVKAGPSASAEQRRALIDRLRTFLRELPAKGNEDLAARATLMGGLLAAQAAPPDSTVVLEFLDRFEERF